MGGCSYVFFNNLPNVSLHFWLFYSSAITNEFRKLPSVYICFKPSHILIVGVWITHRRKKLLIKRHVWSRSKKPTMKGCHVLSQWRQVLRSRWTIRLFQGLLFHRSWCFGSKMIMVVSFFSFIVFASSKFLLFSIFNHSLKQILRQTRSITGIFLILEAIPKMLVPSRPVDASLLELQS